MPNPEPAVLIRLSPDDLGEIGERIETIEATAGEDAADDFVARAQINGGLSEEDREALVVKHPSLGAVLSS